jgi:hypothetical protein
MIDTSGGNTIVLFLLGMAAIIGLGGWALIHPSGASIGLFIAVAFVVFILMAVNFN